MAQNGDNKQRRVSANAGYVATDASSKSHHGLGFWPPPSDDENDPLRWPRRAKVLALVAMAFFNFAANFAGAGLSVASVLLEAEFQKTEQQVNALLTVGVI
jgi:hypothetical protein